MLAALIPIVLSGFLENIPGGMDYFLQLTLIRYRRGAPNGATTAKAP